MNYKGQLEGFPDEVVEKMLEYQVEQGNKKEVAVFESKKTANYWHNGFSWGKTKEGTSFWSRVIVNGNFALFFEKYPIKPQKKHNDIQYNDIELDEYVIPFEKHTQIEPEKYPKKRIELKSEAQKLADEHWAYVEDLLIIHGESPESINKYGFHYKSAFIHGYKHAKEDKD